MTDTFIDTVLKSAGIVEAFSDSLFYEGVFKSEGGGKVHKVKGDLGGTTKWGISERYYGKGTKDNLNIENLTKGKAIELIDRDYLIPSKTKWGSSKALSYKMADISFNAGAGISTEIMQRALNDLGYKLKTDGKWAAGGKTDKAFNDAMMKGSESILMQNVIDHQILFYSGAKFQTKTIPQDKVDKFYDGWVKRAQYNPLVGEHTRGN